LKEEDRSTKKEVMDMLVLILQIGITMLVPILMCTVGGAWLGHRFGLNFLGVLGFVLGSAAGFQNVYQLVKKYLKDKESPGQQRRKQDEGMGRGIG
jgi:hypothetical protein